jgi:hypothetical protein
MSRTARPAAVSWVVAGLFVYSRTLTSSGSAQPRIRAAEVTASVEGLRGNDKTPNVSQAANAPRFETPRVVHLTTPA